MTAKKQFGWLIVVLPLMGCVEPNSAPPVLPTPGAEADEPAPELRAGAETRAFRQGTLCNIESLSGTPFDARDMPLQGPAEVQGWLAGEAGAPVDDPALVLVDAAKAEVRRIPLQLVVARPDVVAAFPGTPGLEKSGFKTILDPGGVAAGRYHMYLTYETGPERYVCDNGRFLRLGE